MTLLEELKQCGDWYDALTDQHARLERIERWLQVRERHEQVFPLRGKRLESLRLTPLRALSVVACAQDPYPGMMSEDKPLAMGLAFSVPAEAKIPDTLKNIFKELSWEYDVVAPDHGDFSGWARAGVLLLNRVMTVKKGRPDSHTDSEWAAFTQSVLAVVNDQCDSVAFLLMGLKAHELENGLNHERHHVIKTSHPSNQGFKASGDGYDTFLRSSCFRRANEFLKSKRRETIPWAEFD